MNDASEDAEPNVSHYPQQSDLAPPSTDWGATNFMLQEPLASHDLTDGEYAPLPSAFNEGLHMPSMNFIQPFDHSTANDFQSRFDPLGLQSNIGNAQALPLAEHFAPVPGQSTYGYETIGDVNPTLLDNSRFPGFIPDAGIATGAPFIDKNLLTPSGDQGEKFRFNATLQAPTSMFESKSSCESYLNKGKTYTLLVTDLAPSIPSSQPLRYRTFVHVTFENKVHRSDPESFWQLWADSQISESGDTESGELLAVEYIEREDVAEEAHCNIQVERKSFDGFCITWTADPAGVSVCCPIQVRFNFTSTDFTHSKGVKGVPLRLCAKTEALTSEAFENASEPELCFCRIKLFRDHGAERKSANDSMIVRKAIKKLEGDLLQAQSKPAAKPRNPKRRRRSLDASKYTSLLPGSSLAQKEEEISLEEDLQTELVAKQDMLLSNLVVSSLSLRGDEKDDPDLFPVRPPGRNEALGHTQKNTLRVSDGSLPTPVDTKISPKDPKLENSKELGGQDTALGELSHDSTGQKSTEHAAERIACYFIKFSDSESNYYRAIYLEENTAQDLVHKICEKRPLDPSKVTRILHVKENGLRIMVDDDVVCQLQEGQSMIVEIDEDLEKDGDEGVSDAPIELRLKY